MRPAVAAGTSTGPTGRARRHLGVLRHRRLRGRAAGTTWKAGGSRTGPGQPDRPPPAAAPDYAAICGSMTASSTTPHQPHPVPPTTAFRRGRPRSGTARLHLRRGRAGPAGSQPARAGTTPPAAGEGHAAGVAGATGHRLPATVPRRRPATPDHFGHATPSAAAQPRRSRAEGPSALPAVIGGAWWWHWAVSPPGAGAGARGAMTAAGPRPRRRGLHPAAWWLWAGCLAGAASRTTNPLLLGSSAAVVAFVVAGAGRPPVVAVAGRLRPARPGGDRDPGGAPDRLRRPPARPRDAHPAPGATALLGRGGEHRRAGHGRGGAPGRGRRAPAGGDPDLLRGGELAGQPLPPAPVPPGRPLRGRGGGHRLAGVRA